MADNNISFEITANTKPAGKALLELSKLINKAITQETKGSDKGVIQQQKEYKKLGVEINNVWKDVKRLNEEDKKKGGKTQLPFTQYAANEKKIADLEKQISNTKDLDERTKLTAKLNEYKRKNATMDKYAEQVLKQLLGTDKAIVKDEQSILGIRTEQVNKAKQAADSTKSSADAEENLNKQTKNATNSLTDQAKAAEKANDALNKTPNKANKKTPEEKRAEKLAEITEKVKGLSGIIDNILSKEFGGPEKFNFDQFDRARISLEALRDMLKELGIPPEFKEDYNRIQQALDKIALGRRMLTKENNAANKQPVIPVKQLEDEAAAYEQRLYELKEKTQRTLSQMMDTSGLNYDDLRRRQEDLKAIKKAMEELHIPKELASEYNQVDVELRQIKQSLKEINAEPIDTSKIKDAVASLSGMKFSVDGTTEIGDLLKSLSQLEQAKNTLKSMGFPPEFKTELGLLNDGIIRLKHGIFEYNKSLTDTKVQQESTKKSSVSFGKTASEAFSAATSRAKAFKELISTVKNGFNSLHKVTDKVKSSFDGMARNMKSNFKHMLTNITKYVFGFRSLFFLVRRLRKYLVEGIENLVQFDSANNQTNAAISELRTSLLFLKNAWAAAFAPIINIVVPIINSFLNALAVVGNAVARFIGFLTGQAPVINAVRVSAGDYAESLSGVGDSAGGASEKVKELTDRLADFDDLDVLGVDKDPSDTGSGGGGGGGGGNTPSIDDMFEWVDVEDSLFDKLKESWKKADFTWLGELLRDKIIEALDWLNDHWDEIQAVADKIGHSLGSFLVGLLGEPELWEKSAHAIAEAFNTINIGISAFLDELDKIPFGENAGKGVNEFLSVTDWELAGDNINRVITGIIDNITKFIEELDAEKIASAISDFLEGLDIPEIVASVGELTIKATKLLVEVIGELILNTSTKFADALTKWVQESITTTYVDSDGVHVKLSFELETDWKEHPIIALFEQIAMGIGATISKGAWIILIKFGIYNGDFGKFIADADKFLTPFRNLIDGFFESVAHGMLVLPNIIKDFFTSVIHGGQVVTNWISEFWQKLVEFEEHPFNLFGDISNSDLSTNAGESFKNLLGKWGIDVDAELDKIKNTITTKFGEIKDKIIEKTDEIKENLSIAWGNLKTDAEEKWNLVKDTITGVVETVQTDVEEKWVLIETTVTTAWDNVSTKTQEVWDGMKTKITEEVIPAITEFINTNIPPLVTTIQTNWETIRLNTEEKWELVKGYVIDKFGEAKANLEENLPLFQEFVSTKWEEMSENARLKWDEIKSSIKDKFREAKDDVVNKARELYNKVSGYWDDLKRATYDKFTQLKTSIVNIFEALSRAIKVPLNAFISAIENMVNFAIDGINLLMDALQALMDLGDEALSALGMPEINVTHLEHVSLPRLAQGAVIPPNNEFLAVLGDQSHGTNIEAPLDTIKQAVAEVLANNGNEEVIELLQQLIRVVESKNLTIGDKDIGKANARYTNKQNIIRGTSF